MAGDSGKATRGSRSKREAPVTDDATAEITVNKRPRHQESGAETSEADGNSQDKVAELTAAPDVFMGNAPNLAVETTAAHVVAVDPRFKFDACRYIPVEFIRKRLDTGGRSMNHEKGVFGAAELLEAESAQLTWKNGGKLLTVNQAKRLTVCVMVRILAVHFREGEEDAVPSRQSIRFHALRQADQEALDMVLFGLQSPPVEHTRRSFFTYHFTSQYGSNKVKPFEAVWDAPDIVSGTHNAKMTAEGLKVNDVIFLEAAVRRYSPVKNVGPGYPNGWNISLDMIRVFRMFKAPAAAPEELDSEDEYAPVASDDE